MRAKHRITAQGFGGAILVACLTLGAVAPVSARNVTDTDIAGAINTELRIDNAVSANNIDVSVAKGIVTLQGSANSILAKERARALAEATVGVRAIVNRIEVQPATPRSDKELATAVKDAWLFDPATKSYKLAAKAKDGVVTISGTVGSYAQKELAATVAKGVRGVKGVENEIDVDYKTTRTDLQIKNEIAARLENNVRVDDSLVQVEVRNGKVALSGTVGSLQEKTQASNDAWVAGVKSVNDDDLEIRWWARDTMKRTSAYVARTEEQIQKAVKDAFLYDPRVMSFNPSVEVSGGTVTLTGAVDNLAAKRAAEQDARNTMGVWRVKNHLKVRPLIPTNDELEKRVAAALLDDPYVERFDIDIEAVVGWVYLSGDVDTSFEKNRAERVAEGVQGVVGVVNNLEYDYQWVWKSDWEIRADVKDQLAWSPFVDADDISVFVSDGVVTLSGTVDSWSEYDDAEKNAFQGGAKDVVNNLTVNYHYYGPYGPGYYYGSTYYRGPDYYGPYYEPYQ
jgi:osmotically-inducible protein OsmY